MAPFLNNDEIILSIILPVHKIEDAIFDAVIEILKPQTALYTSARKVRFSLCGKRLNYGENAIHIWT